GVSDYQQKGLDQWDRIACGEKLSSGTLNVKRDCQVAHSS
ncbi:MAG: hypothetical protein ACI9R3_004131, partial [Verrucomicrobiales bacterium]